MTLLPRSPFAACLLLAVACGGKIPIGDGESTGVDTEDDSETADEPTTTDDAGTSEDEDTSSEPTGETGLVCTPLQDEELSDLVPITVNNATDRPILLVSPPACDPVTHFLIEADDGSRSSIDQCFGYCNELGMADLGCDAGCFAVGTILVQPGATAPLEQWYGRLWQPVPTPAECVADHGTECYFGVTPASGELRLSVWRRVLDEAACADGCTCPDGAGSCEYEGEIEGNDDDLVETVITAGEASIEIVITE